MLSFLKYASCLSSVLFNMEEIIYFPLGVRGEEKQTGRDRPGLHISPHCSTYIDLSEQSSSPLPFCGLSNHMFGKSRDLRTIQTHRREHLPTAKLFYLGFMILLEGCTETRPAVAEREVPVDSVVTEQQQ